MYYRLVRYIGGIWFGMAAEGASCLFHHNEGIPYHNISSGWDQNKISGVAILVLGSSIPVGVVIRSPLIAGETLTYPFRSHNRA